MDAGFAPPRRTKVEFENGVCTIFGYRTFIIAFKLINIQPLIPYFYSCISETLVLIALSSACADQPEPSLLANTNVSKIFYRPFQGGTSFVDLLYFLSCVCCAFVRVCLFVSCGHLLGKG